MIHYTPEGHAFKEGLNLVCTKNWFRLVWRYTSYDNDTIFQIYFRLRWKVAKEWAWQIFLNKEKTSLFKTLINNYLFDTCQYIITKETATFFVPKQLLKERID